MSGYGPRDSVTPTWGGFGAGSRALGWAKLQGSWGLQESWLSSQLTARRTRSSDMPRWARRRSLMALLRAALQR